jgi:branched-chain amino acid transport system ATP-binding protein
LGLRADLSLMDEPTEGVQPENIERMAALIRQRCDESSAAFVVVEQNLTFLMSVADDVMVLDHGDCVLQGPLRDLERERLESHLVV